MIIYRLCAIFLALIIAFVGYRLYNGEYNRLTIILMVIAIVGINLSIYFRYRRFKVRT